MTAMKLHRYPSPSGGVALGKIGAGASLAKRLPYDAEVEYLESTGTQWIDTGIYPTQLLRAEIDMQFTALIRCSVLGSNNGASGDLGWNNLVGLNETGNNSSYFWCQWGPKWAGNAPKDSIRHLHTFQRNGNSSWTYSVDSTTFTNNTGISTQNPGRVMYLFACNNNGVLYRQARVKIFSCKIYNGVLVRDYQPVRFTNEQGVSEGAMFDRANPTVGMNPDGSARTDGLYRNRGTGAFLYGNDI